MQLRTTDAPQRIMKVWKRAIKARKAHSDSYTWYVQALRDYATWHALASTALHSLGHVF